MLKLSALSIGYGNKAVLTGLSKSFERGRAVCIAGRNGTGKSTLLRTLAALQPPLGGDITIGGRSVTDISKKELARTVGIVLTSSASQQSEMEGNNITVMEMVSMGRIPYTGFFGTLSDDDRNAVHMAIQTIGIESLATRKMGSLSDGEKQKAFIAKALAQQTPIIILDEPTAFLDYESRIELYTLLQRLAHEEGKLVIFSSHDLDMAAKYVDEIWQINSSCANSLNS